MTELSAVTRGRARTRAELRLGIADRAGQFRADLAPADPADRADAERAETLAQNRQLLAIVNSLPGAAFRYVRGADGRQTLAFIGDRAFSIFAISAAELRQNPSLLFASFPPADRARLDKAMNQPTPWLMPVDTELQIRARDGAERWVRLTARPTTLPDGGVAWDGIILDVDEDVRRRLSHDLLATAVEHAGDAMEITDADMHLQYVNPAFERITGYGRAEVIGKTPGSMLRSGHLDDEYYDSIARTIRSGKVWRGELIARRKDGAVVYADATVSPIVDSAGAIAHFVAVKRDVTARRQAEVALEQARTLLADAIDSISEGLALFDAGDRLILHNRRFLDIYPFLPRDRVLLGLSFEDLARIGVSAGVLADPLACTDPEAWIAERVRLHRDPTDHAIEHHMADRRWIRITERRTGAGGIVGVYTDMTELKRREEAVIHAKEAAEIANQAKSTFLATMSHELRTPLNAIIGFAELIAMQINGPVGDEHYVEYAQDIRSSGEHLLTVINDILDLSRIEAGALELGEDIVDCGDLIAYCVHMMRERAQRAGLTLAVEAAADLPRLRGDQRKLRQALINLLSNAVKFTPTGGNIRVVGTYDAEGVTLRVVDNGIGMEPADIADALTPFKQVDNSLARKYEGTGLGLPLAKSLLEMHGGSLELVSELGSGTTAICRLPAARFVPG